MADPKRYSDAQGRTCEPTERQPRWSCGCGAVNWPDMDNCWRCSWGRRSQSIDAGATGPGPTSAADEHPAPVPPTTTPHPIEDPRPYSLGAFRGERYIECHTCHRRSFKANDIKQRYCDHCHRFHHQPDQHTLDAGLAEIRDRPMLYHLTPEQYTTLADAAVEVCQEWGGPQQMAPCMSKKVVKLWELLQEGGIADPTDTTYTVDNSAGAGSNSCGACPVQDDLPPPPADSTPPPDLLNTIHDTQTEAQDAHESAAPKRYAPTHDTNTHR